MQPQLGIWKRFIRSLLGLDRCSLTWASGRGLLEVYGILTLSLVKAPYGARGSTLISKNHKKSKL